MKRIVEHECLSPNVLSFGQALILRIQRDKDRKYLKRLLKKGLQFCSVSLYINQKLTRIISDDLKLEVTVCYL